jgi:hypothetical protein
MRNFLLTMLLAGTAISPAFAERPGRDDDSGSRDRHVERSESRQERSESRQERSESRQERSQPRAERAERTQQVEQHVDRSSFSGRNRSVDVDQSAQVEARRAQVQQRVRERSNDGGQVSLADVEARRAQVRERVRDRSGDTNVTRVNVNERGRPVIRDQRDVAQPTMGNHADRTRVRVRVPEGARPDRPAPLPQTAQHRDRRGDHWRTDWRSNHRYDWRNHRRHNRSIFHLGFYFDPFGWNYHRYGIGWRLWPSYYSSNYWLNDPYMYRLPYAAYPYKWVRYYNDAILVDTISGQVVDVIYDFFW